MRELFTFLAPMELTTGCAGKRNCILLDIRPGEFHLELSEPGQLAGVARDAIPCSGAQYRETRSDVNMSIDLDDKSLDQLRKLRRDVDNAIKTYQERERKKALHAVEAKAAEMGFSLNDLVGSGSSRTRKVHPPKYRDPSEPTNTWSGRGRQPGWVKDLLASGKSLDDYLIR